MAKYETMRYSAALAQAVWLYNGRRPHTSLNYQTPAEVHREAA